MFCGSSEGCQIEKRKDIRVKMFVFVTEEHNMIQGKMDFWQFSIEMKLHTSAYEEEEEELLASAAEKPQWTYWWLIGD